MSSRPTQFASKTGVGTTGLFLCSNAPLSPCPTGTRFLRPRRDRLSGALRLPTPHPVARGAELPSKGAELPADDDLRHPASPDEHASLFFWGRGEYKTKLKPLVNQSIGVGAVVNTKLKARGVLPADNYFHYSAASLLVWGRGEYN